MSLSIDHERVRDRQDRSWTLPLLQAVQSAALSDEQLDEAFRTLAYLGDYRSLSPLTAMVEDTALPARVRQLASRTLCDIDDITAGAQCRRWWAEGDEILQEHALGLMQRPEADIVAAVAGDDAHPLQRQALDAMAFGFEEAEYQQLKIRALRHPDPRVRETAADILMWDEPVAAEEPLLAAAGDPSADVARAAVETLQYYPSRKALRALADLRDAANDAVRSQAVASFDYVRGCFLHSATFGDAGQVQLLREWLAPVADLVRWPEEIQRLQTGKPYPRPARVPVSEAALMAMLQDPDGEWADRSETLHRADWEAYPPAARKRLASALVSHPDPVIRGEIATAALGAWHRADDLLTLLSDPSFGVRKMAMYALRSVPRDPAIARRVWEYLPASSGIHAHEALQTYIAHTEPGKSNAQLAELAQADPQESVRTTALSCLADAGAAGEVRRLAPLLLEPPAVTWAVHIGLLDAFRSLGLPAPPLGDLAAVDNLYLHSSVVALMPRAP